VSPIAVDSLFEAIHLGVADFGVVLLSVVVGAVVQGAVGFGLNLVVVPVVAVLEPAALPAAMIIMALPMTAGSAIREPSHTDLSGVVWTTLADCPASPAVPGS